MRLKTPKGGEAAIRGRTSLRLATKSLSATTAGAVGSGAMDLYDEFRSLIAMLNRHGVEYAVCGGIALAVHGYPRFTCDIDLLIREDDLIGAIEAARSCGFLDETGRIPLGPNVAHRVVKTSGAFHLVLDLVLVNDALQPAWDSRIDYAWQDLRLSVVSVQGLALMKRLSRREQDLLDAKMLENGIAREGRNDRGCDS